MTRLGVFGVVAMLALAGCDPREDAPQPTANSTAAGADEEIIVPPEPAPPANASNASAVAFPAPVSYTHLTLPTIYSV